VNVAFKVTFKLTVSDGYNRGCWKMEQWQPR